MNNCSKTALVLKQRMQRSNIVACCLLILWENTSKKEKECHSNFAEFGRVSFHKLSLQHQTPKRKTHQSHHIYASQAPPQLSTNAQNHAQHHLTPYYGILLDRSHWCACEWFDYHRSEAVHQQSAQRLWFGQQQTSAPSCRWVSDNTVPCVDQMVADASARWQSRRVDRPNAITSFSTSHCTVVLFLHKRVMRVGFLSSSSSSARK